MAGTSFEASASEGVNYTVLDVNEGAEKRETEAFIQAYAKGGQLVAEGLAESWQGSRGNWCAAAPPG